MSYIGSSDPTRTDETYQTQINGVFQLQTLVLPGSRCDRSVTLREINETE